MRGSRYRGGYALALDRSLGVRRGAPRYTARDARGDPLMVYDYNQYSHLENKYLFYARVLRRAQTRLPRRGPNATDEDLNESQTIFAILYALDVPYVLTVQHQESQAIVFTYQYSLADRVSMGLRYVLKWQKFFHGEGPPPASIREQSASFYLANFVYAMLNGAVDDYSEHPERYVILI